MIEIVFFIGSFVILVALNLLTAWKARQAEARYPPEGRFVSVNGRRLHYVRQGQGNPQAVVLLHGSDGFWQDFQDIIGPLSTRCDVIAFDRPGHGYSDIPDSEDCAPDAQADTIRLALCQIGITKPVLVGHSWSGALLMAYALKYPDEVAGLTLLAGWVYAPDVPPSWLLRVPPIPLLGPLAVSTLLVVVKNHFLRKILTEAFAPDPVPADYARLATALWLRWPRQVQTFARENTADRAVMRANSERYRGIQVPVVIVAGEQDTFVPPRAHALRLHDALPRSELRMLPHAGHELPQTRPQAVLDAIDRCCTLAQAASLRDTDAQQHTDVPPKRDRQPDADIAPALSSSLPGVSGINTRARELVMRYGWNAMSYQLLNPDMEHWFSCDGEAVIGFMRRNRVRVVAGAPVCAHEKLTAVVTEFERAASEQGDSVCYFGASSRLQTALRDLPPHDMLPVGAQPVWTPAGWPDILKKNSSLRAQVNRARNKGVTVTEWPAERASRSAGLQRCLDAWMATHPLPPLHFLTEAVTLDRLADRRLFVATPQEDKKDKEDKKDRENQREAQEDQESVTGFLIATPVPDRNGWLIEQIARSPNAPNGTVELLVDAMMHAFAAEGCAYVTLGMAPLSRRANVSSDSEAPPRLWLRLLLSWVRAHGTRFYNFEGLDAFKAKFRPDVWEPLYAISNETRFSPRTLYAIAAAFSDGPPPLALSLAMLSALKQEIVWLRARLHSEK
jgi:phosphatidylglycerol lysyltransferase